MFTCVHRQAFELCNWARVTHLWRNVEIKVVKRHWNSKVKKRSHRLWGIIGIVFHRHKCFLLYYAIYLNPRIHREGENFTLLAIFSKVNVFHCVPVTFNPPFVDTRNNALPIGSPRLGVSDLFYVQIFLSWSKLYIAKLFPTFLGNC